MQYILIFLWIAFFAIMASRMHFKRTVLVNGIEQERFTWFFAFLAFLPIILMAGFRSDFVDTWVYRHEFVFNVPSSLSEIPSYMDTVKKDKGFSLLTCFIKILIGDNDTFYFLIIAAIQGIIILSVFRKYSTEYVFSVFLFVVSTDYISWMFNGIRQFMAVVIIFAGTVFMLKKKYIPLIVMILLASTMHQSALLMIPIVFIVQGQAWNRRTLLFIALTLIIVFSVSEFTSILDSALVDTQYKTVVSDIKEFNDTGTHPIRVLVYSLPAVLSFLGKNKIKETNDPMINLSTNMSIVTAGLYIISMFTSGMFLGRLPIYVSLFNYILLPWELKHIIPEKQKALSYGLLFVGYFAFYLYQMHVIWELI